MVPSIESTAMADADFATGPAGSAWSALSRWLDDCGLALREEVRDYPTPIARCDVQLTKLLEHRGAIIAVLGRMRALEAAGGDFPTREAVAALLAWGPATDDPVEALLRDNLRASLHALPCLD